MHTVFCSVLRRGESDSLARPVRILKEATLEDFFREAARALSLDARDSITSCAVKGIGEVRSVGEIADGDIVEITFITKKPEVMRLCYDKYHSHCASI
jgi:hypothetical protein